VVAVGAGLCSTGTELVGFGVEVAALLVVGSSGLHKILALNGGGCRPARAGSGYASIVV
jgi:hypothetical protein